MGTWLVGLALLGAAEAVAGPPVTTESLLREMTDLRALAEFPDPAFKTVQFSSYDRRSQLPGGPGWFSNADGFGGEPIPAFESVLREPGSDGIGEYLVCDVQGPGAIVRCWTAAINGSIRMELDDRPTFDGSADDFFRRPFNILAAPVGIDPSLFDGSFNQQNAAYCPIAFGNRCRIVWTGNINDVHFYEVQIREYERGASVRTFTPEDLRASRETLLRTADALRKPGAALAPTGADLQASEVEASAGAHAQVDLFSTDNGPREVVLLRLHADARDLDLALRQTVLHIFFDGAPHAQVEAPLGDFFGAAPGINPFDSAPFTVEADGWMTCRFVMPYAKSLLVRAVNMGEQEVHLKGQMETAPYEWSDRSMHFRARWRVDHGLTGDPAAPQDIPFLFSQGSGRYVGTASIMLNPTDVPTPGGGWWGEGDEKIFVDDDVRPSTYGTGSEDYYDYAWSIPDIFGFAYCGQPRNDGPGNRGFVTNHRWHILDSLPFRERIAFSMELWTHRRVPGFSYARLSYHYARPGTIDDHMPITAEDVRPLELPAWKPLAEGGARNSTFIEAETDTPSGDQAGALDTLAGGLFSGGRALRWKPAKIGDELSFGFDIATEGNYVADLCALHSGDSGRVRVWVDDRNTDEQATEADLAAPGRRILRRLSTHPQALTPGRHELHVRFLGEPGQIVGIDFLWIQPR